MKLQKNKKISVVIPCYKVKNKILQVIKKISKEIKKIYVIDDCCPQKTGAFLKKNNKDKRVKILFNKKNMGVGKATMKGLEYAFNIDNADIEIRDRDVVQYAEKIISSKNEIKININNNEMIATNLPEGMRWKSAIIPENIFSETLLNLAS